MMKTGLDFRKGAAGGAFSWISYLDGKVVGLCKSAKCTVCKAKVGDKFAGGRLEVVFGEAQKSRATGMMFFVAHLAKAPSANQMSESAILPDDHRASMETDAADVTAFVYKDSKTGRSIMFDAGGPLSMNGDIAKAIDGLVEANRVEDIVITHGHLDHRSHVPPQHKWPVHMSPLTRAYLFRDFGYQKIETSFSERIFSPDDVIEAGPFKLKAIAVPHSIPQTCVFLGMTADGRTFLHMADAKIRGIHWREEIVVRQRLAGIGNCGGVGVFHVDNLNCHRPGFTPEESEVCRSLSQIIAANTGRVIIGVFASNINRIKALAITAAQLGRCVEFAGRSGMRFTQEWLADEGFDFPSRGDLPPVVFASGCQGEPDSVLWKEVEGIDSPNRLDINERDLVVFSSHRIPGNDAGIAGLVGKLLASGCRVVLNSGESAALGIESAQVTEALTHCSGHGHYDDVKTMIELVKPRAVIPSVRYPQQMNALREICLELGVPVLDVKDNCFVL